MAYQPIENYGIIGNMHTVALVSRQASIDWLCFPHFDSPAVFCSMLDDEKGGYFKIAPSESHEHNTKQLYWPDTNVLITRFLSRDGVAEVIDFMGVSDKNNNKKHHRLYRMVKQIRGNMKFNLELFPSFNYARDSHSIELCHTGARFFSKSLNLRLTSNVEIKVEGEKCAGEFELKNGETSIFVFEEIPENEKELCVLPNEKEAHDIFNYTVCFWRKWLSQCTYSGRWRETVHRSALTLKLLTYEPTGAIVAAPTCSLPESLGGKRNWDYRYTWIRDAAFTLYAFLRIGFKDEARRFMEWIESRCHELNEDGSLQIMYGINGEHNLKEDELVHLKGYKNSSPVRVGNDAYNQLQLDIYGELMDSVYLHNKYGSPISYDLWKHLRRLIDWVCNNWKRKDEGIWEVRGGQQHFVYSKIMCWVALDRALRLAEKRSFPTDRNRWLKVRDEIYEEIINKGWNDEKQAFMQSFGSDNLDAANLIMPLVFFLSPNDPRMIKTLSAIMEPPHKGGLVSDSLVYRYNNIEDKDGVGGEEGTFNICSFWMVEALTRAGKLDKKHLDEARLMFEKMLSYANHLGLFAEETGPCGEALGNFPQAFTHLSLISAAFNLDKALGNK